MYIYMYTYTLIGSVALSGGVYRSPSFILIFLLGYNRTIAQADIHHRTSVPRISVPRTSAPRTSAPRSLLTVHRSPSPVDRSLLTLTPEPFTACRAAGIPLKFV